MPARGKIPPSAYPMLWRADRRYSYPAESKCCPWRKRRGRVLAIGGGEAVLPHDDLSGDEKAARQTQVGRRNAAAPCYSFERSTFADTGR